MNPTTERKGPPPHQPEPLEVLRGRFAAAVEKVWDVNEVLSSRLPRTNFFDFEDGVRFTVSRELHEDGRDLIHVSISAFDRAAIAARPDAKKALLHYWQLLTEWPFVPDHDGVVMSRQGHAHCWMPTPMVMPAGGVA